MFEKEKMEKKEEPNQVAELRLQVAALQGQILQQKEATESSTLEKQADAIKKETAALAREADVKSTLAEAFNTGTAGLAQDEELEQHELITIMGDAVGNASKAQEDLILGKVATLLKGQEDKIDSTRKVILELVTRMGVEKARSSFPDFNDVRGDVQSIMVASGLDAEDAYLLHKARIARGGPGSNPATERPEIPPAAPSRDDYVARQSEQEASRVPKSAKQAFRDACGVAIDKTIAARSR